MGSSKKTKRPVISPPNLSPSEINARRAKELRPQVPAQSLSTNAAAAAAIAAHFATRTFGSPASTVVNRRGGGNPSNNNAHQSSKINNRQLPTAPSFGATGPKKF